MANFNPADGFISLLETVDEHPNWSFSVIAALSAIGALVIPGELRPDQTIWFVPLTSWFAFGRHSVEAVGAILVVGTLLAAVTPTAIGRGLATALAVWRIVQFAFAVAAFALSAWAVVTLAVLAYLLLHGFGVVPPEASWDYHDVEAIGIVFAVLVLVIIVVAPVVRDLARLIAGLIHVAAYSIWASRVSRVASPPDARVEAAIQPASVLLVSDLHGTAPGARTVEGDRDDEAMRAFVALAIEQAKPKLVIAAGDMTDTGQREAWQRLKAVFPANVPLLIAPGNHDVNFRTMGTRHSTWETFRNAFDLKRDEGGPGSYAEVAVAGEIDAIAVTAGLSVARGSASYPRLYCEPRMKLGVLILNSNRRESTSPITNALGLVGEAQLKEAERLLAERTGEQKGGMLLLVMHHHLLPAPKASIHDLFLVCVDARSIFDFVQRHGVAAVIHGHKHMPYVRKIGPLHVVSLGSALYDASGPCAAAVRGPSVAGLEFGDGTVRVVIHPDRGATPSAEEEVA